MLLKATKQKIAKFCAYQERSHQQVRAKLKDLGVNGDDAEEAIVWLIEENFLNEERFAKAFCTGKFRHNDWGKIKIKHELKQLGVSEYCIKNGLNEIEDEEYLVTIQKLIQSKLHQLEKETNLYIKKQKTMAFLVQKGYESNLIAAVLNEMMPKIYV
jgi:regulatory protein